MVAVFDTIPKHIQSRMLFSGKVEEAAQWSAVMQMALQARLSEWQFAVTSGELRYAAVFRRADEEEMLAARQITKAYAAFLLPLVDRGQPEGRTLVSLIVGNAELLKDGVKMHAFITKRGMASSTMQVKQAFAEIEKIKLPFDGGLVEHEAVVVQIRGMFMRIDPDHRGGPTRL